MPAQKGKPMDWARLYTEQINGAWWILGDEEDGPYGPYSTRREAEDDCRGVIRSMVDHERGRAWTT